MNDYRLTVGLEIHAELKTLTKMFCACWNDPDEKRPNLNICPVCMAHPGALPVINKEAIHKVLLVGSALGGTLAQQFSEFDRKNYFYPDIPKGYQISQYKYPLVSGGVLSGIPITRIHLEEDTARSQHEGQKSLVDYNRAGVPLMELVTEAAIHTAKDAADFGRNLQLLLRALDVGEANMEKGQMRVEANISISKDDTLGTKVEVKNLNSFRSVERAIAYECDRQQTVLESGAVVVQETRGWDESKQATFSQRLKESSEDYRYFPEPDLPKLVLAEIPEFSSEVLRGELPELPSNRRSRYIDAYKIKPEYAELFVQDALLGSIFEGVAHHIPKEERDLVGLSANYIASDIVSLTRSEDNATATSHLTSENFYNSFYMLMSMIQSNKISSRGAKDILVEMYSKGGDPEVIATEKGLLQQSDEKALLEVAKRIVEAHQTVAAEYRAGKMASLQFLIGQGMKDTKGSANPKTLREAFDKILAE